MKETIEQEEGIPTSSKLESDHPFEPNSNQATLSPDKPKRARKKDYDAKRFKEKREQVSNEKERHQSNIFLSKF